MSASPPPHRDLTLPEYRVLAEFRYQIRRFLCFSEEAARSAGVEPRQYQCLLAIKGLPEGKQPTVGELANRLCLRPHTALELVNRLVERGAVERHPGPQDRRQVVVRLTEAGEELLRALATAHFDELQRTGPALAKALRAVLRQSAVEAA